MISLSSGEFLLGLLGNGFLAVVNFIDLVKNKKLSTGDLILVSLAISRIFLLCLTTKMFSQHLSFSPVTETGKLNTVDVFWILAHFSNVWFAFCLSIFYFLKIASFSHSIFLWLKWRINRVVFVLQGGHVLITLPTLYLLLQKFNDLYKNQIIVGIKRNVSQDASEIKSLSFLFTISFNLVSLLPFTLCLVSFSLLIISLWRHTRQMQLNATGSRDPSMEAHIQAMKTMSSFLILFFLCV
ncbi:taste receptor type 2 member 7-like [Vombatus ursinus]|uniref:taste receptor type 2 member 7-like n=1 Tax=Vombatus ursinus TaxID=29139 RepID=UPI000FFD6DCE|nr:taste receptor type 2 member 7-like [Vombatus ursinus]